jgi:putative endopeptidase
MRDPARAPAKYSLVQLSREMPGFDWFEWARPQGMDAGAHLILSQPGFFRNFAALVPATPIESWKAWLTSRYLTASAPFLTKALSDARFEFFGRVLTGQELPRTHWKRGVSLVNAFLGDALGRLYVERHFPPSAKARVERIVSTLVAAFREAISEAGWLSERAKRSALEKLARLSTKVGYPDRWRDYGALVIKPDDLFGNVRRARHFENQYRLARQARPTDRGEWLMTPQTINAYYSPAMNEIVVPAAMLQPPLFTLDADDAVNSARLGRSSGTRSAMGSTTAPSFRRAGEVRNWWTTADEQA